jgi:hypothetical protein
MRLTSANTSSRDAAEGCVEQRRVGAFAELDLLMVGARRNHEASTPGYASPPRLHPGRLRLESMGRRVRSTVRPSTESGQDQREFQPTIWNAA